MPGFPGAAWSSVGCGLRSSAHASACSRPPDPTTSTFTRAIVCEGPAVRGSPSLPLMEAPPYSAAPVDVVRLPGGGTERDHVAVEEPLEIRIGGRPVAVTMRTPGHDEELALGFCLSEGLRPTGAHLPDALAANAVAVDASGFDPARLQRS